VFSRAEREFLELLADSSPDEVDARLKARFPNPVYRRRLRWGIRQKATAGASDWTLFARAARHDERVVRPLPSAEAPTIPLHTEPFAALVKRLTEVARARARTASHGDRSP